MKGVILAAGKGCRLSELNLKHKSFAIVKKHHLIDYSLDLLLGNESSQPLVDEIIIVVGYNAQAIIDYVGDDYHGVPVKYAYQTELKGVAHAMLIANPLINDDAIMCLADEILFDPKLDQMIEFYRKEKLDCASGVIIDANDQSGKPIGYSIDDNGFVSNVFEKPASYSNSIRGIGECIFSKHALSLLCKLSPNTKRGEYEMGDWMQLIIDTGGKVKCFELASGYANINYAKDIDEVNKRL